MGKQIREHAAHRAIEYDIFLWNDHPTFEFSIHGMK